MTQSPEWKAIAVAATVAGVSMSLLAVDATLDLSVGGLTKRLESAQTSFVDTLGQYQLALAVPTWIRSMAPVEHPFRAAGADCQRLITDRSEDSGSLAGPRSRKRFGHSLKKMVGARGFEPPTPSLPD